MNGIDMEAWKEKVCEVGRNLGRAKGMVKYHECELRYCQTDNEADVLRDIISDWSAREAEQEEELDNLIGQLLLSAKQTGGIMNRRDRYFQNLWDDVVEICGEDSVAAGYLREIIEFWKDKPLEPPPTADFLHVRVVGLRNEMLRAQGKQPWSWRDEK